MVLSLSSVTDGCAFVTPPVEVVSGGGMAVWEVVTAVAFPERQDGAPGSENLFPEMRKRARARLRVNGQFKDTRRGRRLGPDKHKY